MEEVECPGLAAENAVWFFKQLRGLADAVRHIHALKPLPALYRYVEYRCMAESDEAVFHNDIKPENILVFDSRDGFPGVFKISDFGCGKIMTKDESSPQQTTEKFYGTPEYESPDLVRHKKSSKPNDLWALGCVFLELLDWFALAKTDKQVSFQSQRYTSPGPTTAAFWYRDPERKYHQFQLKFAVGKKLVELENKACLNKRGFDYLLVIIWALLDVDIETRWDAERVYSDMNWVTRQAMVDLSKDPDYYLRPGRWGGTNHLPIAAYPGYPTGSGQAKTREELRDITAYRADVNAEIRGLEGNTPSFLARRLMPEPVNTDGPRRTSFNSPFVQKLQRLQEAGLHR
jgi:serine/threonine protein kinase